MSLVVLVLAGKSLFVSQALLVPPDSCPRWIALLLGRYRLDIATCMAVYMEIARDVEIAPDGVNSPKRKRTFKLDQDRLTVVVEKVLERYDLDPSLLSSNNEQMMSSSSRCKHA